jgi:hypothetical protein
VIVVNTNSITITASQLNSIIGVSGAIEGVNYTSVLANSTFVDENNPTPAEIQTIIDLVNESLGVSNVNSFEFQLFPNPTKTQFIIQLENTTELENVTTYNNLGQ